MNLSLVVYSHNLYQSTPFRFKSTQADWFRNFKRLHLIKQGARMDLVPDGPIVSTLFATGRENLKHVCVEFEVGQSTLIVIILTGNAARFKAPQNSDLVLLLSQFLLTRPLEYTLTLQAHITRKDSHGPILLGIFPNSTAKSLLQSNWALYRMTSVTDVKGIPDDHYTVLAETSNFINTIASDSSIVTFLNKSRGKDNKGSNLSIDDALLCPKIKYLVISDSFRDAPINKMSLFADYITVTLKTTIPSPHSSSLKIHEAYASVLKFFLLIVDYIHTNSAVSQKTLTSLLAARQNAHDDPHDTAKKLAAEEKENRIAKISKEKNDIIDNLPEDERARYLDAQRLKETKRRSKRVPRI